MSLMEEEEEGLVFHAIGWRLGRGVLIKETEEGMCGVLGLQASRQYDSVELELPRTR